MTTTEHARRRALMRNAMIGAVTYRAGPSKAELQAQLAEAVRNTLAMATPDDELLNERKSK
ncbi:hypothetical protein [Bradyrhizobium sp. BRP23]|uniref:hypothetical protein n=1 Tax=Bradyrhizobium sp. BRP23 TaxID=2793820 RepID=UPI001CD2E70C|nr:hypothetical protein [Bradyrhizobium sp. BRP23]MCA1381277.1 hypothetical protein [Bradyrhizobium sp. BRP05]MCA1418603.1 hypothetical protein [Bradyrhizobium sp. BRP23]